MLIEFTPSPTRDRDSRPQTLREFRKRFVEPLGAPRKKVSLEGARIVISMNAPGALSLVPTALEIASGTLNELTLEEIAKDRTLGLWIGDLEPQSLSLSLRRVGPPIRLLSGFRFEPPKYRRGHIPPLDEGASISVYVDSISSGPGIVRIKANGAALVGFAQHLAYISNPEAPSDAQILWATESVGRFRGRPLVFRRAEFHLRDS